MWVKDEAPWGKDGQGRQVDVWVQRGAAGEHRQDGAALGRVGWRRDVEPAVKAAGPQQGRVNQVRSVGGRHHNHIPPRLQRSSLHLWA